VRCPSWKWLLTLERRVVLLSVFIGVCVGCTCESGCRPLWRDYFYYCHLFNMRKRVTERKRCVSATLSFIYGRIYLPACAYVGQNPKTTLPVTRSALVVTLWTAEFNVGGRNSWVFMKIGVLSWHAGEYCHRDIGTLFDYHNWGVSLLFPQF
jgi:hypothetical protein